MIIQQKMNNIIFYIKKKHNRPKNKRKRKYNLENMTRSEHMEGIPKDQVNIRESHAISLRD